MSSGFLADAPRGLYELEVWNSHPEPVNVGFYLPGFSGVTYATRVWEVNPYISGTAGLVDALVHVTPFNALMWDNGDTTVHVIEHAVMLPDGVRYQGDVAAGIVVVNNLGRRGRRLGRDVFEYARREVPLELVGMDSEALGGSGEVANMELAGTMARYRFFFNPIRYTSLGLAVVEAMTAGLPIVALATTGSSRAAR